MPNYRRANTAGATYFFTVVAYQRQPILCDDVIRLALRSAITATRSCRPFDIEAWVLLPDHLHCIWTLPDGDADFAIRWNMIKRRVSLACRGTHRHTGMLTVSKRKHRESTIWQRRYWEHRIRNDVDFARHVDYIHYNPVKHGFVAQAAHWPYSTLHRDIARGICAPDWGGDANGQTIPTARE